MTTQSMPAIIDYANRVAADRAYAVGMAEEAVAGSDQARENRYTNARLGEAGELDAKSAAERNGPIPEHMQSVVGDWIDNFRATRGKPPTYGDYIDSGFRVIEPEVSRLLGLKLRGTDEAVGLIDRALELMARTGEPGQGVVSLAISTMDNIIGEIRGLVNFLSKPEPGETLAENRAVIEEAFKHPWWNAPDQVSWLDEISNRAGVRRRIRVITSQLAFALARAEGQRGRAITQSILESQYLPRASEALKRTKTAITGLTQLRSDIVIQLNRSLAASLGDGFPAYVPKELNRYIYDPNGSDPNNERNNADTTERRATNLQTQIILNNPGLFPQQRNPVPNEEEMINSNDFDTVTRLQ